MKTLIEAVEPRLLFAPFVVTTTADAGAGSLRQAILDANANDTPAAVDDDITFNIPGSGVRTISLASPLPTINGNVTLDATSQPGYDVNHTPVVEINGQGAGAGAVGLRIASLGPVAASTVLGLIINRFSGAGVVISGDYNYVAQCYIGTNATAAAAGPGNGGHGVLVTGDHNFVTENVIAFNGGDGVAVAAGSIGNTIAPNSFFSNGGLGIDLGDDGPTANDAGDADDGPNRLQNYPVITSVTAAAAPATGINVSGSINTTPNTLVEIALYSSPTGDGEGRNALYVLPPFETNASGNGTFTANLPTATTSDFITATATSYVFTATSSETNTSEFSPLVTPPVLTITQAYVRSSAWAAPDPTGVTFMEYLESHSLGDDVMGYRVDNKPAGDVVPWVNLNEIVLRITGPVPTPAAITIDGVRSDYIVETVTALDAQTIVLRLGRALGTEPAGTDNGDRIRLTIAGSTSEVRFNVLQGDVDQSGSVLANDYSGVKARFFKNTTSVVTGSNDYTPFHDVDGNGSILANDYSAVKSRFFDNLPPAAASASSRFSATRIAAELL